MIDPRQLASAVRYEGGVSRRLFLAYGAALAAIPQLARRAEAADRQVNFASNPFTLGVASGDPDENSVVLWTRLAPKPLETEGGMGDDSVNVRWELAEDDGFQKVVASGTAAATPQFGHAVHVEAKGLAPDHWYFYRFRAGDADSPIGRTRTLPAPDAEVAQVKFAFASCQHFEHGLYTAYEQMMRDNLDLVFHLGDYIYEYEGKDKLVRKHVGKEIKSLSDYRVRHAQYKTDSLLQGMHALCPWFVTWDDHEFDNNCANYISEEKNVDPVDFLVRRANSYQAYYENMPLRPFSVPKGPDMQLYRSAKYGKLAEFCVLDERQYRSDQPNNDKPSPLNEAANNPQQSMLGSRQREWLQGELLASQATWNVLAQQVMMGQVGFDRGQDELLYSMDQWSGYSHERRELLKFMQDRQIKNPIVLTGDIHSNWANELRLNDRDQDTPVIATEFVCTSISSGGNGSPLPKALAQIKSNNPFVKFHSTERGYVRCTVTPQSWTSDYVTVTDVLKPGGRVLTRWSAVAEAGEPGLKT